ncbi:hypothetical protein HHI36_002592 [Cryptolaemus montrouzieri]|uniref:Uncharacterized protein n=1 Tax=Cryptolaemus montrouzieri TaxID=559131 RepID=A0ABD2PBF7_9CUCU
MKGVAVIFVCIFVATQALTDEQIHKLDTYREDCAKHTGVDKELAIKARNGDFVEDEKLKEHLYCFSKKIGFQNEAGDLQLDVIRQKLAQEIKDTKVLEDVVKKCAVKKDTPQETSFQVAKCYSEHKPKQSSVH